jgi:acetoin utilization deacetylase AcuC-like enzyme
VPAPIYYAPGVRPDWDGHVFPVDKYRLTAEALGGPFAVPQPATREQLLLVHTAAYLDRLEAMTTDPKLGYAEFEVPCTRTTVDAFALACGATVAASRAALAHGAAGVVGGGFHHAFADRGEGFCLLNDLAVAVRVLQQEERIATAAVIDLDLHQGNGTARIFQGDRSVFTFSMHQQKLYPVKETGSWDIGLDDFTSDGEYLPLLRDAMPQLLDSFAPDLVVYQAGADPYKGDQLGSLQLSKEGLAERDRIVVTESRSRGIPIVATLGGGYARETQDVVDIHAATLRTVRAAVGA